MLRFFLVSQLCNFGSVIKNAKEEMEEVDQVCLLVLCSGMFFKDCFKPISCCVGFLLWQSTELSFAVCLKSILRKAVFST